MLLVSLVSFIHTIQETPAHFILFLPKYGCGVFGSYSPNKYQTVSNTNSRTTNHNSLNLEICNAANISFFKSKLKTFLLNWFFFCSSALRFASVLSLCLFASVFLLRLFLHKYLHIRYISVRLINIFSISNSWGGHNSNKPYGFFMNLLALCFFFFFNVCIKCSFPC